MTAKILTACIAQGVAHAGPSNVADLAGYVAKVAGPALLECERLAILLEDMREECDRLEADAARYRYLRDSAGGAMCFVLTERRESEEWDAEIDAEIAALVDGGRG